MLKFISIIFMLFSVAFGNIQNAADNYRLNYPKYIPAYSQFDVSLITSNPFQDADRFEIYIVPDLRVSLNKINLRSSLMNKSLHFTPVSLHGADYQAYKTVIHLSDTTLAPGIFFQVLFNFTSESNMSSQIKIFGVYKKNDKILGKISSKTRDQINDNFITANINFYKPQKVSGNSVLFSNYSQLKIAFKQIETKDLLADFWIKANSSKQNFLQIKNKNSADILYTLSTNQFQMLLTKINNRLPDNFNPEFLSLKSWYHVSVNFLFDQNKIDFYCNSKLIAKANLAAFTKPGDITLSFGSDTVANSFQIDLLRFVNLDNSIDLSFRNQNYLNFISDSSRVVYQFSFDNGDQLNIDNDRIKINSSNLQYVRSDAPIFARAPELNISILSNAYELKWSGGDYKQAKTYVLQKSSKNSGYQDVYKIASDNDPESEYSFIDNQDENSDVVYYRVKQINSDGSVVYSSQVKVGQGTQEPFIIHQNYPNPFNPTTSIVVELLESTHVNVSVYNLEGKEVAMVFNGDLAKGIHSFTFDGTNLPSGVYLYKITTPNYSESKKMILTK